MTDTIVKLECAALGSQFKFEENKDELINKLGKVLSQLLTPTFKSSDDTVLQKLFDCITLRRKLQEKEDPPENYEALLELFIPWYEKAVKEWLLLTDPVKVFTLKIGGFISSVVKGFNALVTSGLTPRIIHLIKKKSQLVNMSLALGYVQFLNSVTIHKPGLNWIIKSGIWKDVVALSHASTSIYLLRESWGLLSTIIVKMEEQQLDVAKIILGESFAMTKETDHFLVMGEFKDPEIHQPNFVRDTEKRIVFMNSAKLAIEVILTVLNFKYEPDRLSALFKNCRIQDWAWTEIHSGQDTQMISIASRVLCVSNALNIHQSEEHEVSYPVAQNFIFCMASHFNLLITRHLFEVVLDSCVDYQFLWDRFGGKVISGNHEMPSDSVSHEEEVYKMENVPSRVENFLFCVQAMPLFVCTKVSPLSMDKLLERYFEKLTRVACPKLIRLCYYFRDELSKPETMLEKLTTQIIHRFIKISTICKKEQAVYIFQAFMHLLKEFVTGEAVESSEEAYLPGKHREDFLTKYPEMLSALLNGLICYLSKFSFSWRDSLETVCALSFAQNLISNPEIPPLMCAQTLKMAKLILLNFMPPNLALLVDTLQGSTIKDLGKQLYKTLHSLHWEVRDSTLEVLTTISGLAEAKFPAFQTLLMEQSLPELIVSVMECDSEPYVRASAISCIGEMVKIPIIWDNVLKNKGILEKLLLTLRFESEGIVRKQAAVLVKDIYFHRTIVPSLLEKTYDTMYYLAQNDLHWEVKVNALDFWDAVLDRSLSDEGMVDGSFPEMIFSKEKKKIIQLNSHETCYLVLKALRKLSNIGCLHVLWATILEECDLEVQRKSVKLINKLKEVVYKYKVMNELEKFPVAKDDLDELIYKIPKPLESDFASTELDSMVVAENEFVSVGDTLVTQMDSVDAVIDQIIQQEDIQLLPGLMQTFPRVKRSLPEVQRFIIPAEEFIEKMLPLDIERLLEEKLVWALQTSEGINSLMDDILQFSNHDNYSINSIDCY